MTQAIDLDAARRELKALQADLAERQARIEAHHRTELDADSTERAVELENEEVVSSLEVSVGEELTRVRAALARIETGTYDVCQACGGPIGAARLKALPYADRCIGCA